MSEPFTIDATNWQEKAEELRLALSERSRVMGGIFEGWRSFVYYGGSWQWSATIEDTPIQGGENLQAQSFWNGMQAGIENLVKVKATYGKNYEGSDELEDYPDDETAWFEFCRDVGGILYVSDEDYGWPKCAEFDEEGEPVYTRGRFAVGDYITGDMIDAIVLSFENLVSFSYDEIGSPVDSRVKRGSGDYTASSSEPPNDAWAASYDLAVADLSEAEIVSLPYSRRGTNVNATKNILRYRTFITAYDFEVLIPSRDIEAVGFDLYYKDNGSNPFTFSSFANDPALPVDVYQGLPGPPPSGYTPTQSGYLFNDYWAYETVIKYDFTNA